ncbi:hypothetical protein HNR42_000631 [Deinobacterium chartae]|uniref:Uncharacterized protein n=1 Tax=Deinobacterium chartae TaxID=521158 RepID=A0A841HV17_9DEIO|nr:hypothetical protein [Deinobacterium chartae]MBB6097217.1 hypothetical protein [Deinobacterium chartae]
MRATLPLALVLLSSALAAAPLSGKPAAYTQAAFKGAALKGAPCPGNDFENRPLEVACALFPGDLEAAKLTWKKKAHPALKNATLSYDWMLDKAGKGAWRLYILEKWPYMVQLTPQEGGTLVVVTYQRPALPAPKP